jgi:cytochrome c peroxidase
MMGWGDDSDVSQGTLGTLHWRNSQTLLNAAYFTKLNWDGSKQSLEEQARDAILSSLSGNADPALIEERLAEEPEYVELFKKVYGLDRPTFDGAVKALAAFQREVPISRRAPLDAYLRGDREAISKAAVRGMGLFTGKAGCIQCHNGPLVSDESFRATGVPANPAFERIPLRQVALRFKHVSHGVPEEVYRSAGRDPGLYLSTLREEDIGKFRVPSLRELLVTAPYMHNGVFPDLKSVIAFYNKGGGDGPTNSEKKDLIEFLKSMTGEAVHFQ